MPAPTAAISALQNRIWAGSLPLEIRLAVGECRTYDEADPYLISVPRLSYLPFLLPRLHAFFASSLIDPTIAPHEAWFSFQDLPLKWHYPIGLLYDLFSGASPAAPSTTSTVDPVTESEDLPWKLTLHYTSFPADALFSLDAEGKVLLDSYINSVKEADYIRNGTAKTVMSMSKADSNALWRSVETHDLGLYNSVNNKLLNPPGLSIRHIPIKVYLPTSPAPAGLTTLAEGDEEAAIETAQTGGSMRVVQGLVAPVSSSRQAVTLGAALNEMLPTIFPSRRNPVLASPVSHGALVPMSAPIEELGRAAAYTDGFLHIAVVMLG